MSINVRAYLLEPISLLLPTYPLLLLLLVLLLLFIFHAHTHTLYIRIYICIYIRILLSLSLSLSLSLCSTLPQSKPSQSEVFRLASLTSSALARNCCLEASNIIWACRRSRSRCCVSQKSVCCLFPSESSSFLASAAPNLGVSLIIAWSLEFAVLSQSAKGLKLHVKV